MGRTVDQIEDHIVSSREDLRSNLEELGAKVKSAVDWRARFRANPGAILAVAFGGGFILANLIDGSRGRRTESNLLSRRAAAATDSLQDRRGQALRAWDDIQSALVGVVAAKVTNTLAEVIPGFKEQLVGRGDNPRVFDGPPGTH
jgi:hypothetical protein